MKHPFLCALLSTCMLQANSQLAFVEQPKTSYGYFSGSEMKSETTVLESQPGDGFGKMSATTFKNQEYCRAELENFEFDAHFSVIGATVYFSGANFKGIEKGTITSSSLKPLSALMARCIPGSIVIFDEVKVVGPDKKVRTIPGISLRLY
ncbi:GldM family protein [Ferruginibacter sp. SUN002]|uniref:GldM family protein n=1 Tax=Ferruginibacter sp. SUN002 TaxID=2937789 RepID=UPI003D36D93D